MIEHHQELGLVGMLPLEQAVEPNKKERMLKTFFVKENFYNVQLWVVTKFFVKRGLGLII